MYGIGSSPRGGAKIKKPCRNARLFGFRQLYKPFIFFNTFVD
jgi:hypothetical protein